MNRSVAVYRPGSSFPPISVTGSKCELSCSHCSGRYLRHMRSAITPDALMSAARYLDDVGADGFLLSGGSDATGKVPLEKFAGAVKEVKETTALRINAHVGLMPRASLASLVSAGVDAFSVDVYGADSAVQRTLGLRAQASDFLKVVENLKDLGAPVIAPHVCIGIERGRLVGEMRAIDHLRALEVEKAIFIIFTPTKGTPYEAAKQPSSADVASVLERAREELPHARLLLGCMRPRRDRQYEIEALSAGIDGIAMPSEATLEAIRQSGARLSEKRACCAMD